VVGLGLGLVATPSLIAAQTSVEWNERGVVTGTNLFARSIGSSIGVAVFGAVANAIYSGSGGPNPQSTGAASTAVFFAVLVSAALTVVAVLAMPREAAKGRQAAEASDRDSVPADIGAKATESER
jgi:hypothetical protein